MSKYKVIFFTGAGISVDSGIPTFQEQPGIREKLSRDFANEFPEMYRETVRGIVDACENAKPNAAHKAIAETGFPVITMNVDKLHTKAGSKDVVEVHGVLPTKEQLEDEYFPAEYRGIVLYGDRAPEYERAMKMVRNLEYGSSYFVIVGTSFYTGISEQLRKIARQRHANIIIINDNASERVPHLCDMLMKKFEKNEDVQINTEKLSDEDNDDDGAGLVPHCTAWDFD